MFFEVLLFVSCYMSLSTNNIISLLFTFTSINILLVIFVLISIYEKPIAKQYPT